MEAGFRIILVSFFLVCFGLTYTYKLPLHFIAKVKVINKLPLHFIAKVKVIKEKEEVCSKCFHTFICYFVSFLGANVILFFKKQTFYELFLLNFAEILFSKYLPDCPRRQYSLDYQISR